MKGTGLNDELTEHPWTAAVLSDLRRRTGLDDLEFHESIASTNTRALERLRQADWRSPTLVLAHEQTRGRGRGENRWWSVDGGLTFSLLIEPSTSEPDNLSTLTLRAGLAVAEAIETVIGTDGDASSSRLRSPVIGLKWPNDLWIDQRKIGGLLVESIADRPGLVVGLGLNVNQRLDEAPAEVRQRATSLFEHDGRTRDLPTLLGQLVTRLDRELTSDVRATNALPDWVERFRQRCVLTDRFVQVAHGTRSVTGRCGGIDAQGRLVVSNETGSVAINSGKVEAIGAP